jgi:2-amino-4-hydroxy-6-hydroxymethyldihydropteridine diphosphokinase
MRVPGVGGPRQVVETALAALSAEGLAVVRRSDIVSTAPLGPSRRRYANATALVASDLAPPALLVLLQRLEKDFGRRRRGERWRARPLDLDIVLWSCGAWQSPSLIIPHRAFRSRDFVLAPAKTLVPRWRDPLTGLSLAQIYARLTHPRPLPRSARGRALSSVGRATDF